MVAYAPTADLLDRLGISIGDDREGLLSDILEASSRWVDKETARTFTASAAQTRYFTAGSQRFYIDGWTMQNPSWGAQQSVRIDDLLTLTSLKTDDDGDGVYETTWTVATDYWLGPRNAIVKGEPFRSINRNRAVGRYSFPAWENGVSVTGTFGYSAVVPSQIKMVTLEVASILSKQLLDISVPGAQVYKLGTELSVTMDGDNLPAWARRILHEYRDTVFI